MANGDFDFTAGQILTAAQVDDYLMLQSVEKFATSAARDSALTTRKREGMHTYQDDSNCDTVYSGAAWSTVGPLHGAWTAYTPTWTNLTVGNGTLIGAYQRIGRTINYKVQFVFGSTSSVTGAITLTVPFAAASGFIELESCAGVMLFDANTTFRYVGYTSVVTSTTIKLTSLSSSRRDLDTSANSPFTWAVSDTIFLMVTYEAAADA